MATSLLGLGLIGGAGAAAAQNTGLPQVNLQRGANPAAHAPAFKPAPSLPLPSTGTLPLPFPKTVQVHNAPTPAAKVGEPELPEAARPAAYQIPPEQPPLVLPKSGQEVYEFRFLREIPGLEVLTRLDTEEQLRERMRQEGLKIGERVIFPDETQVSKELYPGRHWSPMGKIVEPAFVVHGRLHFEQPNLERGLWDFGVLTPVMSFGKFCWDVTALPYYCGTRPGQHYDTSAGKCLPGDPVPFYLYPPELSLTGAAAQTAVMVGGIYIFP